MPIMEGFNQKQKPRQRNIFEVSTKCYPAESAQGLDLSNFYGIHMLWHMYCHEDGFTGLSMLYSNI